MDDSRRWWSYLLWILALGVGIGFSSSALSMPNSLGTLIKTSSMPAAESIPIWSVPQPQFVLPILRTLRPWIVPNPDIEATMELDWENIQTLTSYAHLLRIELQNRIHASEDDLMGQLKMDDAPPEIAHAILLQKREEIQMLGETKKEEIRMLGETKRMEMEEWARRVRWEEYITGDEFLGCP